MGIGVRKIQTFGITTWCGNYHTGVQDTGVALPQRFQDTGAQRAPVFSTKSWSLRYTLPRVSL